MRLPSPVSAFRALVLPLLLAGTLTSCSSMDVNYLELRPTPNVGKVDPATVVVIPTGGSPQRPYDVLGELRVTGSRDTPDDNLLRRARKEAGKRGANAIIVIEPGAPASPIDARRMALVSLVRYK